MLQFATSVCIKSYFSGYRLHRPHLSCLSKAQGAGAKAGVEAEEGAECMAVTHPKQTCPLEASPTYTTAMLPQALLQPPAPCSSRRGPSRLMLLLAKVTAVDSKTKATAGRELLLHASFSGHFKLVGKGWQAEEKQHGSIITAMHIAWSWWVRYFTVTVMEALIWAALGCVYNCDWPCSHV